MSTGQEHIGRNTVTQENLSGVYNKKNNQLQRLARN